MISSVPSYVQFVETCLFFLLLVMSHVSIVCNISCLCYFTTTRWIYYKHEHIPLFFHCQVKGQTQLRRSHMSGSWEGTHRGKVGLGKEYTEAKSFTRNYGETVSKARPNDSCEIALTNTIAPGLPFQESNRLN